MLHQKASDVSLGASGDLQWNENETCSPPSCRTQDSATAHLALTFGPRVSALVIEDKVPRCCILSQTQTAQHTFSGSAWCEASVTLPCLPRGHLNGMGRRELGERFCVLLHVDSVATTLDLMCARLFLGAGCPNLGVPSDHLNPDTLTNLLPAQFQNWCSPAQTLPLLLLMLSKVTIL